MANQTGRNILIAYKVESAFNTPPVATGAKRFRLNGSQGLKLNRAPIRSNEIRSDLKTSMPRLGSKSVAGSYQADLSVGSFDDLIEAVMRGTWTAAVACTQATGGLTSVTTQANSITASAGSWITAGVRVGDVLRFTGLTDAANNNKNLRVTSVSALILGIAETLVVNAVADSSFGFTISKKVFQPASPVGRSFTFEEYFTDIDVTKQATGCRVAAMKITGQPDGMALVDFSIVGADLNPLPTGSSPFYTSPTLTSSIALTWTDAVIRFAGADVLTLTGFDLTLDMRGQTQPVIGSVVTPDVFLNNASLTGSISAVRKDLSNLTAFAAETELEFSALLVEPESEPKDFISLFVPRMKLMSSPDEPLGGDGAMIETMQWEAGDKEVVSGYDDTMIMIATSAP